MKIEARELFDVHVNEEGKEYFPVTYLAREDIADALEISHEDAEKLSSGLMVKLADRICETIMDDFWMVIDVYGDEIRAEIEEEEE